MEKMTKRSAKKRKKVEILLQHKKGWTKVQGREGGGDANRTETSAPLSVEPEKRKKGGGEKPAGNKLKRGSFPGGETSMCVSALIGERKGMNGTPLGDETGGAERKEKKEKAAGRVSRM